jgi:uncharacterized protein
MADRDNQLDGKRSNHAKGKLQFNAKAPIPDKSFNGADA